MSVFTPLERHELEVFLAPYGLGRLRDFQGIAAGSENSNFFVSLEQGQYVLTLVERGPTQDLPFFIELLEVLHRAGLPVPYALQTADGDALRAIGIELDAVRRHAEEAFGPGALDRAEPRRRGLGRVLRLGTDHLRFTDPAKLA